MNNWIAPTTDLLPDFIIGGAMKCGTSTLHEILNQHPKVFLPTEEIGFFDSDNILEHNDFNFHEKNEWITQSMDKDPKAMWDWYQEKFKGNESLLKGEDSTTYLASRIAAKRISLQKKPIKLIFLLRQPSLRTYSNYYHVVKTGRATCSFENMLRYYPFEVISRSLYKEQIENYYKYIPKARIKVILFEDFVKDAASTLKEVCEFLGLDHNEFPKDVLNTHANKAKIPISIALQLRKNALLRGLGNATYTNILPFKSSQKRNPLFFAAKVLNKGLSILNPKTRDRPPKINPETKLFLDHYFYNEMEGIDELLDKEVLSKWFPTLEKESIASNM